jgi:hypothetical protein
MNQKIVVIGSCEIRIGPQPLGFDRRGSAVDELRALRWRAEPHDEFRVLVADGSKADDGTADTDVMEHG